MPYRHACRNFLSGQPTKKTPDQNAPLSLLRFAIRQVVEKPTVGLPQNHRCLADSLVKGCNGFLHLVSIHGQQLLKDPG